MEVRAVRCKILLVASFALVVLWQILVGVPRPGTVLAPAGDAGLCLAIVGSWFGMNPRAALFLWVGTLVVGGAIDGVSPLELFLIGWPAWLVRGWLKVGRSTTALLLYAAVVISLWRLAGKLLLSSFGGWGMLTISGASLTQSLWAELIPNLVYLTGFTLLLKSAWKCRQS